MNLMLFNREEFTGPSLHIRGVRARELIRQRHIALGDKIRVGEFRGQWGWGVITEVGKDLISLDVELATADLPKPITLVVGLPRPQILKKVLQTAAMMGVSSLVLVRSERSEKSFLQSPLLNEATIEGHLRIGLEQGIGTVPPQVHLFRDFRSFRQDWLEQKRFEEGWKLVAEPKASHTMVVAMRGEPLEPALPGVAAIGPEGGWQDEEIEAFIARGFRSFQLGNRILRVDIAVPVILGQIALLTEGGSGLVDS